MVKWAVKKPVKVATVKYTGDNLNEIIDFVGAENVDWYPSAEALYINTLEGKMIVLPDSVVIKGPKGEFYPCRGDIFNDTYNILN